MDRDYLKHAISIVLIIIAYAIGFIFLIKKFL